MTPATGRPASDVLEWVRTACARYPDDTAIRSGSRSISYRELDAEANRLANTLKGDGVGLGSIAAVLADDRVRLPSAMLGVLRAGCVFVPLDPDAPPLRLERVLAQLRPDVLVASSRSAGRLRDRYAALDHPCRLVLYGESPARPDVVDRLPAVNEPAPHGSPMAPLVTVEPDALAYVYYTSGSTGQPKGVAGRLGAVSQRIRWELETFEITRGWRVSQLIAPTFDAYLRDVFVPLCTGGTLCVPPADPVGLDPVRLLEWLEAERVNLIHCVPSVFSALAHTPAPVRRLPDLRLALLSGEPLHVPTVRRWRRRFSTSTTLVNLYGATEATMVQLFHVVREADLAQGFVPIGKAMSGDEVFLVDESGAPCQRGTAGEIVIRSPFLSLGYLRDEDATRAAFGLADPNVAGPPSLYRTGDLGVELEDGSLRLLGRRDTQVKVRGVRVDLGEVEAALLEYPSIAACAVVAQAADSGDAQLVAYVETSSRDRPGIPELRLHLRQRLTLEMLPARFAFVDRLPRSANGKIDRQGLSGLAGPGLDGSVEPCSPRTEVERTLAAIWVELLAVDAVGVHDDFLSLGGHSLTATRLAARVREAFGVEVPVRAVFDHPTLGELAEYIEQRTLAGGRAEGPPDGGVPLRRIERGAGQGNGAGVAREARNLVMVVHERLELASFERLADEVRRVDPTIRTFVLPDVPGACLDIPDLPTLVFGPNVIRYLPVERGRVCCGAPLAKHQEYEALAAAGIPVPPWLLLTEDSRPDPSALGEYVVRKPDFGAKGAEVRIVRGKRVRWHPIVTAAAGLSNATVLQRFVYTGPWPVSYRVNTLFGNALYAIEVRARTDRPILRGPHDFLSPSHREGVSIVSNARDSQVRLCFDETIIRLGERAHSAFPSVPLLGVDILREVPSGHLYVVEVNALGFNWNFTGREPSEWGVDVQSQFDGFRKAARVLAEQTRLLAC